jgi:hypothetical protein
LMDLLIKPIDINITLIYFVSNELIIYLHCGLYHFIPSE